MKVQFPPIAGAAIAAASIIASQLLTPLPLQATSVTQPVSVPLNFLDNIVSLFKF